MTDLEAIKILEAWNIDLANFGDEEREGIQAHNQAISALRERIERKNKCSHCVWGEPQLPKGSAEND